MLAEPVFGENPSPADLVFIGPCDLGLGVFAATDFAPGAFILKFTGGEMDFETAVSLGDQQSYLLQVGPARYIDPEAPGRLINHSCNPNAGFRNGVELHALRQICEEEEIRFDYSTTMSERHWTMPCQCGAACCREIVRDFHELPEDVRAKYLAIGIVSPFIVEEIAQTAGRP